MGKFFKPTKRKLILCLIIILVSFRLYYHRSCINLAGVECKLFYCPTPCGFFPLEFLIIILTSYMLSCIIFTLIKKPKPKK